MGMLTGVRRLAAYWHRSDAPGRKLDWPGLAVFVAVACVWSWFASRWGALRLPGGGDAPRVGPMVLIGFGPVLGAMAAGAVRDLPNWPAGFRGLGKTWAMAALALPILLLGAIGVDRFHVDAHVDAAVIAASLVVACAAEEIGWREWLYNAFAGLPLWASALATWALWLGWHLVFAATAADRFGATYGIGYVLSLLVASLLLAVIVRQTRSSAIAAAWRVAAVAEVAWWQTGLLAILLALVTWKAAAAVDRLKAWDEPGPTPRRKHALSLSKG